MKMHFEQIRSSVHSGFAEAMEIYLQSFPANEQQPWSLIQNRVDDGDSILYAGKLKGKVVCFGMLWYFNNSDFVLLDYLAVHPSYRGLSLGSELIQFLATVVRSEHKSLVLEVEHPFYGSDTDNRLKRVNFYFHNGAFVIDHFTYFLPPMDASMPTEMILMLFPASADMSFDRETIQSLIVDIYNDLYFRPSDDVLLNTFIHLLPPVISISQQIALGEGIT